MHNGTLILVNEDYSLKNNHMGNLIPADMGYKDILLKPYASNALQFIMEKIGAGRKIVPVSGYRSLEEQTQLFDDSIRDNGEEFTNKYVAKPNHSEHQTGLAIDLGLNVENIDFIRPEFSSDGICGEFIKNAPDYGFVQRYKEDKEDITKIAYEPWHFRYTGYPHSKIMEENNLSLEEYTDLIKDYRNNNRFVFEQPLGAVMEIFFVPANDEVTEIEIPKTSIYQISGNNVDGFVVTVWR